MPLLASAADNSEILLLSLTAIAVLGIGAQWISWRLRAPSILLLLMFGFLAGNTDLVVRGTSPIVDPDALLGDLLFPVVSLGVAVILFEGGLTLRYSELREVGGVVFRLVSLGALVTWLFASLAARHILGFDTRLALLFGAILIVTGPTVIQPLLTHVRPLPPSGPVLKWEGIVIDPIGAMVTVLVFEAILIGEVGAAPRLVAQGVAATILAGSVLGGIAAILLLLVLSRFWVPDYLANPVSLLLLTAAFTAANVVQDEAGLLAAPVMGLILANQKRVAVRHIVEFNENLRVLMLAGLFIVLGARVTAESMLAIGWRSFAFLAVLVLVARPISVMLSSLGSGLTRSQRLFLAWMAPRGVVAAAIASIFAIRLAQTDLMIDVAGTVARGGTGRIQPERLVPETFFIIVTTVALYGLTARPVAKLLGVATSRQQGVLLVGAYAWVREIATALQTAGHQVLLVDTNRDNLDAAAKMGLPVAHANVLAEHVEDELELDGIGRVLALTSNEELNSLVALKFVELFGRKEVYQLPRGAQEGSEAGPGHLRGRMLFGPQATFANLTLRFARGAHIMTIPITEDSDHEAFQERHRDGVIPLFLISQSGDLTIYTDDTRPKPRPGQTLITLVDLPRGPGGTVQSSATSFRPRP